MERVGRGEVEPDFVRHVDAQSGKRVDGTVAAELVEFAGDLVRLLEGAFD